MKKRQLAIFDFCNTLVPFQSADRFVDFVLEGEKTLSLQLRDSVRAVLSRFGFLPGEKNKRAKLQLLKGMAQADVESRAEDYVEKVLLPHVRRPVLDVMMEHKEKGDHVILVSGGYESYLTLFAKRYGVEAVGTRITFSNGICQGAIDGLNCMGENKVTLLKNYLRGEEHDLSASSVYTDEEADRPLLDFVGHGVIVSTTPSVSWNKANRYKVLAVHS
jgi:HAD superfamily hydrolase (TIGR01490 family)